jgi:ABC-type transport system substrate-binding protein
MRKRSVSLAAFSVLVIASMLLAACTAPATTPQVIRETVVVTEMVEGTPVERVITSTPAPDEAAPESTEGAETAFLPAGERVECRPIPEIPEAGAFLNQQASLASRAGAETAAVARRSAAEKVFGKLAFAPAQQDGVVYNVGVFEDVTTLNFWAANGPDNTVWNSYMLPQRLTMFGQSDLTFTFVPAVAAVNEPPELTQDGEFWVTEIPLRQDVTWSDGEPFTAEDVAFTANTTLAFGLISGNWSEWYDGNFLERVEAVDDYTVRYVYHTRPGLARHEFGTLQAPILAAHYWAPITEAALAPVNALAENPSEEELLAAQQAAQQELFAHVPDGEPLAGAFVASRWEQGAFLDNEANPDYFDAGATYTIYENGAYQAGDVTVGEPEGEPLATVEIGPHVDAVVYTIYGTQDAAILALREGEVDFVLNSLGLQRGLADQIRNDPNLTVIENPTNGYRYLSFNNRRRPMNDCAFRQAVGVLIDKEFVTGTILQGAAYPIYTFIPEGNEAWYTADVPKLGEGLDRQKRLALAIAILEQAGYTFEGGTPPTFDEEGNSVIPGGRLIMPDGVPVPQLTMIAPSAGYDPLRSTFAIWIETWLNEFGIPVTAELAGFNVLIPRIFTEQDFDMYILGWSLGIFPSSLRDFFSEEQSVTDGNNAGGYISSEFEELSSNLLTCTTFEECKGYADQVQALLATEMPYVLLFDTGIIEAYRSAAVEYPYDEQLSGLQFTHQGGALQPATKIR